MSAFIANELSAFFAEGGKPAKGVTRGTFPSRGIETFGA